MLRGSEEAARRRPSHGVFALTYSPASLSSPGFLTTAFSGSSASPSAWLGSLISPVTPSEIHGLSRCSPLSRGVRAASEDSPAGGHSRGCDSLMWVLLPVTPLFYVCLQESPAPLPRSVFQMQLDSLSVNFLF